MTANLGAADRQALFETVIKGEATPAQADLFRGQMLTEMAKMSLDAGWCCRSIPARFANHNSRLFADFGRDMGADIPRQTDYVSALKPLQDAVGNEPNLTVIAFTLDETAIRASWRRWPGITPPSSNWGRAGGSSMRPKPCCASAN